MREALQNWLFYNISNFRCIFAFVLFFCVLSSNFAFAANAKLILKDGKEVSGDITGNISIKTKYGDLIIPASEVLSFKVSQNTKKPVSEKIEGKWRWEQNSNKWIGDFLMTQNGNTVSGILVCPMEGDYKDPLENVKITGEYIEFIRNGHYGRQHWKGKLTVINGELHIINGYWRRLGNRRGAGSFSAQKLE